MITSEAQLEDVLSAPSDPDIAAISRLSGTLLILGVGGKMGPSLAKLAHRSANAAGTKLRIVGVSRFSSPELPAELHEAGIETHAADLLDPTQVANLPDAEHVVYMAGRKFGSTGNESLTWAMNAYAPALIAERYGNSRIVAFSSGNIYPFLPVHSGGATESTPLHPVGEYAQSVLARERILEYMSLRHNTPAVLLRLNYAIDLRYGVLLDIGRKVFDRQPLDVTMGNVNVIWQGDANSVCLRSFEHCQSPPLALNLTGPETLSVRWIATQFAAIFKSEPEFTGTESPTALLNNAARCFKLFGYPRVTAEQMIEWTAQWIAAGGATLDKPTHFETRDGRF